MENLLEFIRTDYFLVTMGISVILLLILYITNLIKMSKIKKEYNKFLTKLGNGQNIEEQIKTYMDKVLEVKNKNMEIEKYCKQLDKSLSNCLQKIGIVRYNAFKDTGSDLSFALAILNEENTGIVLNGIYSREVSNIYAKPIEKGSSKYTLSEEEKEAIQKAINV